MEQRIATVTAERLATEINIIKEQAARQLLAASVAIGERLEQAKALVPFGEWGDWLEHNVEYSTSTAQNLMRIAKEYGSGQITLSGRSTTEIFGTLTYSQAVALFALPAGEREDFLDEHDAGSMSTREFQQAIDEKKAELEDAERLNDQLSERLSAAETKLDSLRVELSTARNTAASSQAAVTSTQAELSATEKKLQTLRDKNKTLAAEVKELTDKPAEITPEQLGEIEKQAEAKYEAKLAQLSIDADHAAQAAKDKQAEIERLERRLQTAADARLHKFNVLFEQLQAAMYELHSLAQEIGGETGDKLAGALKNAAMMILEVQA